MRILLDTNAFTTISVSDGISMSHRGMRMSLLSHELIADSGELVIRGHAYDALIGFAACDKTPPGIMMGMVRLDCPSVFVYGGAMLPGLWQGRQVRAGTVYEGVGVVMAEAMSEAELAAMGHECAPTLADVIAAA
jgi:dihydroxy-acid dehydratase